MPVIACSKRGGQPKENGPLWVRFLAACESYFFVLLVELLSLSEPVLPLDPAPLVPKPLDPVKPELPEPLMPELPLDAELRSEPPLPPELPCEPELPVPDFELLRLLRQSLNSSENLR